MSDHKKEMEAQVNKMVADFQERNTDTHIRVFVTYNGEGESYAYSSGGGSFFAQVGIVSDWLAAQRARTWHDATREKREDGMGSF